MFAVLGLMKHGKVLRGTPLDPFGWTAHRKLERRLITEYEATVDELCAGLTSENRDTAVAIASIPEQIRGFDLVEKKQLTDSQAKQRELLAQFRAVLDAGRIRRGDRDLRRGHWVRSPLRAKAPRRSASRH